MEEDLTPEDDDKEYEEFDIDTDNPLFVFCFMFMEYIKKLILSYTPKHINMHKTIQI